MAAGLCNMAILTLLKKSENGELEDTDEVKQIFKSEISIGRSQDCDLSHENNNLLSGIHCRIVYEKDQGKYFLLDTSKNGTLVNGDKVKNHQVELKDGDIIHCAHKKTRPDLDIVYRFKLEHNDVSSKQLENLDVWNQTLVYDIEKQEDDSCIKSKSEISPSRKRKLEATSSLEPEWKQLESSCSSECRQKPNQPDAKQNKDNYDGMLEDLTCSICQEIFHECVSTQPCMHSFCAACYSSWMKRSSNCPSCRRIVNQVSRNHLVNNLVDAYLKTHPERKRSEEEIKEMNKKDCIKGKTNVVIQANSARSSFSDYDSLSDSDDDGEDYDDNDDGSDDYGFGYGDLNNIVPPTSQSNSVPITRQANASIRGRCRQCPNVGTTQSTSASANQSFVCLPMQPHSICYCCKEPFPDRGLEALANQDQVSSASAYAPQTSHIISPISCSLCQARSCHLYWGCRKPGCFGCLNKFADINFSPLVLSMILNNNAFESNIFQLYLQGKNINIRELHRQCMQKLDSREYTVQSPGLKSSGIVCYICALRNFKELVYQYRKFVPASELPSSVSSRADCHWGKNCRTQFHNPAHASRFNHICEQTRFTH